MPTSVGLGFTLEVEQSKAGSPRRHLLEGEVELLDTGEEGWSLFLEPSPAEFLNPT